MPWQPWSWLQQASTKTWQVHQIRLIKINNTSNRLYWFKVNRIKNGLNWFNTATPSLPGSGNKLILCHFIRRKINWAAAVADLHWWASDFMAFSEYCQVWFVKGLHKEWVERLWHNVTEREWSISQRRGSNQRGWGLGLRGANLLFGQLFLKTAWEWKRVEPGACPKFYVDPPVTWDSFQFCFLHTFQPIVKAASMSSGEFHTDRQTDKHKHNKQIKRQ